MSTENENPESKSGSGLSAGVRSAGFFAILALVLGLFFYLSSLEPPPNMSASPQHVLKFNKANELIGLGDFTLPTVDNEGVALKTDKKGIEKGVNITCQGCHGRPLIDLAQHACHQKSGRCLPEKHPPKSTCIKCHRMPPKGASTGAATAEGEGEGQGW